MPSFFTKIGIYEKHIFRVREKHGRRRRFSNADPSFTAVETSLAGAKTSAEKAGHSALDFGKTAGEVMGDAAQATSNFASKAGDVVSENASKSFAAVKHGAAAVGESASAGAKSAGAALGVAADSAGDWLDPLVKARWTAQTLQKRPSS